MRHQVEGSTSNTIEENKVNETKEINLVIDARFNAQDIERQLHYVSYLSDLRNEDEKYYKFIKHLNHDTAYHYLVSLS